MTSLRSIVPSVVMTAVAAETADVADSTILSRNIVDLSQDLVEDADAMATSLGAVAVMTAASSDLLIRTTLVLENGKIVAKYIRDDVEENEPNHVWSTTKSWTSLLIGLLVDEGLLEIEDTLGDIFKDDDAWSQVLDGSVETRKAVTIEEMLTMTSGLVSLPSIEELAQMSSEKLAEFVKAVEDATEGAGGSSLSRSLADPEIGTKGEFAYLSTSQILSYVIKERTGMTPRELLKSKVMPALGIAEEEYNWLQNEDEVEYGYHGLELTALQMAKFGQLYLQGGKSKPSSALDKPQTTSRARNVTHEVISKSWIQDTFTPYARESTFFNLNYGYLFWGVTDKMYCALGAMGQDICIDQASGRVIVQQRDPDEENPLGGNLVMSLVASDPELSFTALPKGTTLDQESSCTRLTWAVPLVLFLPVLFL